MDRGHVTLTQVASPNAKHNYLLAEGPNGEPMFGMSSAPDESAPAGQIQKITIPSAHHGAGQYIEGLNPAKYMWADGWMADRVGKLRTMGVLATLHSSLATNQSAQAWERGAVIVRGDNPNVIGYVIPTNVFLDGTAKLAPPSGGRWTGSWARLGKRQLRL